MLAGSFNSVQWTNVNTPSVDAITEFAMETTGFKAESGVGGGMITFTSKSGTDQCTASVYEFLRNDKLDARRFFRKGVTSKTTSAGRGRPGLAAEALNGRNGPSFSGVTNGSGTGMAQTRSSTCRRRKCTTAIFEVGGATTAPAPDYDPSTTRANPYGTGFVRDASPAI